MSFLSSNDDDKVMGMLAITQKDGGSVSSEGDPVGVVVGMLDGDNVYGASQFNDDNGLGCGYPPDFKVSPPHEIPSYSFSGLPFANDDSELVDDIADGGGAESVRACDGEGGDGNEEVAMDQGDNLVGDGAGAVAEVDGVKDLLVIDPEVIAELSQNSYVFYSQVSNELSYSSPEKSEAPSHGVSKMTKSTVMKVSNNTRFTKIKYDMNYFLKFKAFKNGTKNPSKISSHTTSNVHKVGKNRKMKASAAMAKGPSVVSFDSDIDNFGVVKDNCALGIPDVDVLACALNDMTEADGKENVSGGMDGVEVIDQDQGQGQASVFCNNESVMRSSDQVGVNRMPIDPSTFRPNVRDVSADEIITYDSEDELSDSPEADAEKCIVDNYIKSSFWVRRIFGKRFSDYLVATGNLVGKKNIMYLNSEDRARIEITLKHSELVDLVIKNGLDIGGVWAKAYRLSEKPMDLLLCDIPAYVPNAALVKPLSKFGKIEAGDITILRTPTEDQDWSHVVGFRRKALLRANKDVQIPDVIKMKYGYTVVKINVISNASKCFGCGKAGHMRRNCRSAGVPPQNVRNVRAPERGIPLSESGFASSANIIGRPERKDTWAEVAKIDKVSGSGGGDKWVTVKKNIKKLDDVWENAKRSMKQDSVNFESNTVVDKKGKSEAQELTKFNENKTVFVKLNNSRRLFNLVSRFKEAKKAKESIGVYPYTQLFSLDVKEALELIAEEREFLEGEGLIPEICDYVTIAVHTQNYDAEKEGNNSKKRPASSSDDLSGPAKANDFRLPKRNVNKVVKRV